MKTIYGVKNIDEDFKNCVVAIGVFDGVHIGHQKIISQVLKQSERLLTSNLIITFDINPEKFLSSVADSPTLTTLEHKLELFSRYHVRKCLVIAAGSKIFNTTAEKFIIDILYKKLKVKQVIIGQDFTFGKSGKGNVILLKQLGRKYDFKVTPVRLKKIGKDTISSSLIRGFVKNSKLNDASKALGRNFSILGKLRKDTFLTKKIGLLFLNLKYAQEVLPTEGLYSVKIEYKKKVSIGLALVGTNYKKIPVVSIYVPGLNSKARNSFVDVQFVKLLTREITFDNIEDSKTYVNKI